MAGVTRENLNAPGGRQGRPRRARRAIAAGRGGRRHAAQADLQEVEELTGEPHCDESRLPVLGRRLGARGVFWMSASERGRLARARGRPLREAIVHVDRLYAEMAAAPMSPSIS